jgi:hypothetical protein
MLKNGVKHAATASDTTANMTISNAVIIALRGWRLSERPAASL